MACLLPRPSPSCPSSLVPLLGDLRRLTLSIASCAPTLGQRRRSSASPRTKTIVINSFLVRYVAYRCTHLSSTAPLHLRRTSRTCIQLCTIRPSVFHFVRSTPCSTSSLRYIAATPTAALHPSLPSPNLVPPPRARVETELARRGKARPVTAMPLVLLRPTRKGHTAPSRGTPSRLATSRRISGRASFHTSLQRCYSSPTDNDTRSVPQSGPGRRRGWACAERKTGDVAQTHRSYTIELGGSSCEATAPDSQEIERRIDMNMSCLQDVLRAGRKLNLGVRDDYGLVFDFQLKGKIWGNVTLSMGLNVQFKGVILAFHLVVVE
ncbi:hypothetical protein MVEN_00182100 [Mycena venus]|uniref:Uncharacterized protein n=1 Tax=Mycena venus TaxID=2733690 RepID=A0A8H6Z191_9AGAR|nr:hypothetical protein MVEN_00182100 [Mycena venus]